MSYDSPNAVITREHCAPPTTAGIGAVSARFRSFQAARLKAVHAIVVTAGTSTAAGHTLTLKHGTTSIAAFALGTTVAGGTVSKTTLNEALAPLDEISITNGTDATGVAQILYEYSVNDGAVQSV